MAQEPAQGERPEDRIDRIMAQEAAARARLTARVVSVALAALAPLVLLVSGWPEGLAAAYLGKILRYDIGSRELEAIELFWKRCRALRLIERLRPMKLYKEIQHGRG